MACFSPGSVKCSLTSFSLFLMILKPNETKSFFDGLRRGHPLKGQCLVLWASVTGLTILVRSS